MFRRPTIDFLEDRLAPAVTPLPLFGEGLNMPRFPDEAAVRSSLGIAFAPLSINVTTPAQNGTFNTNFTVAGTISLANFGQVSLTVRADNSNTVVPVAVVGTQFSFNTAFALNGTNDGPRVLTLTLVDQSNRQATAQVFVNIDTVAPVITQFDLDIGSDTAPVGDQSTTASVVTLKGQTEPGATVVLLNSSSTTTADANGIFGFGNVGLPPGTKTFNVVAVDAAGNQSATFSRNITRIMAPTVTINPLVTNSTTPTITGTVDSATTLVVNVNGQNYNAVINGTTWSAAVTNALAAGTYAVTATATNATNDTGSATLPSGLVVDLSAPSVVISSGTTSPTNSTSIPITVTFSENVTGFAAAELTATNGTIGNFTAVSGAVYTATLTPTGAGVVTVNVAAGVAGDAAGNANTAGSFNITFDNVAPTAIITTSANDPTNLTSIPLTITFTEDVTGLTAADFSATNGTIGTLTAVNGQTYNLTVAPLASGTVTVNLAAAAADDAAGNDSAAASFSIVADLAAPTVSITSLEASPTNQSSFAINIAFTENVTGFVVGDVAVSNGTLSNFTIVNGSTYTATVTPTGQGTVNVNVAAGVAQDSAANGNTAGSFSISFDSVAPTANISSALTSPTKQTPIPLTIVFTEAVTGFTIAGLSAVGGTLSNFAATSATLYTVTLTPTIQGTVNVTLAANSAQDAAGNDNAVANFSISFDSVAPTATIASTANSPTNLTSIPISIEFTENVTGLTAADFTVTNGTIGNLTSIDANSYTATITPAIDGIVTVDLNANGATDAALNGNAAATFSIEFDGSPTVAISSLLGNPTNDATIPITILFDEDVTGFVVGEVVVGNATLSNFTVVDARTYQADLTPVGQGAVTVDVAAGVAQDSGGNTNLAGAFSIVYDTLAPTLAISSTAASPANSIPVTYTFSQDVTGFTDADVVVGNGTLSNFTAVSGTIYTATVTPAADGTVTVNVAGAAAQDLAGNDSAAAAQFSILADITAPTPSITSLVVSPTNQSPILIAISFLEDVTGLTAGDFTVGNGTLSNFTVVDAQNYTATITPTASGTVTVNLAANAAQDAANNGSTVAAFSIVFDAIAPTVSITSIEASPSNAATIPVSIIFSEDVTGFTAGDIVVTNGTASNFIAVDARTYSIDVAPTADGTVFVDVAAAAADDAAGNDSALGTFSIVSDRTAPTPSIATMATAPVHAAFQITISFVEDVFGLAAADFTVANGTLSNFTAVDAQNYTATVTPTDDALVTVSLAVGAAQDTAGNDSLVAAFAIAADLPPILAITSLETSPSNAASFLVTFAFDEDVTGFTDADVFVTNGVLSNFTVANASTYTATVTPAADGLVTVDVAAGIAQDLGGNDNLGDSFSITSDLTAPVGLIGSPNADPTNAPISISIDFSEDVFGLVAGGFTVTNGTLGNFTVINASTYAATITPTASGLVTVTLNAGAVQDAAGNLNAAANLAIAFDGIAPTAIVTSTETSPTNATAIPITVTFSEDVIGFSAAGITVGNGNLGNFTMVDARTYNATVTPTASGAVTVTVDAGAANDAATNLNPQSPTFSIDYDGVAPTATISTAAADPNNLTSFQISIEFNEDVAGFTAAGITVANGTLSNFTVVDDRHYTATVSPTATGTVTVDVLANSAQDDAGNDNPAATFAIVSDLTPPSASISPLVGSPTKATSFLILISFNESVTGLTLADFTVTNGTISTLEASSAQLYTALVSPTTSGLVTVDLAAGAAQDSVGNQSLASTMSITADYVAPTLSITSTTSSPTNAPSFPVTFEFSENVLSFAADKVAVTNGTLSNFVAVDGNTYTATITATAPGTVTVAVAANAVGDQAGNDTPGDSLSIEYVP